MASQSLSGLIQSHLQRVVDKFSQGFSTTARATSGEENRGDRVSVSADSVVSLLEGDPQYMAQLDSKLGQNFEKIADKALDYWLKNTDRQIRNSLGDVGKLLQGLTGAFTGTGSFDDLFSNLSGSLTNMAGQLAGQALESLLVSTRTTVSESQRSQDAAVRYRQSRGQVEAALSGALARGSRFN